MRAICGAGECPVEAVGGGLRCGGRCDLARRDAEGLAIAVHMARCDLHASLLPRARAAAAPPGGRGLAPPVDEWAFVAEERLVADARRLCEALPPDVDAVVAIPRSGLLPGSLVAYARHLPLWTISRQSGLLKPGHGGRLDGGSPGPPRHVLLVDDTAASGREMRACADLLAGALPEARITRAVVYCRREATGAVDLYVAEYPGLHYLAWNWANAGHGVACAYDFDGILCADCPPGDDDDGPRYAAFLRGAAPLYLPRRAPVHTIVTGRHRKYETQTRAWLARWGVVVDRLIMREWEVDPSRPWHEQHGEFKAGHYAASGLRLFAESCPLQAEVINRLTGKAVLCPAAGRVFPATGPRAGPALALVNACPDRGCRTGCQHAICNRHHREVHIRECLECVGRG